ncbi:MAG: hypothetical protein EP326_05225 [Deltaproteobacteria bacterium]|nr:MAG: hypothetical protein EP326_05225 [Deltaproteobacteria bacterium]TNF27007.1 MAG: hypothetical protein EP319_12650 [Deltaproteobacteria bacterium]
MFKLILLSLTLITTSISQAAVWEDTNSWSMEWEAKYQEWIKSDAVHKNLFISPESKYHGMLPDCADAAYAIRAIFSLENKLPFKVINPSGSRNGIYRHLDNRSNKFDSAGSTPEARLVAMINYLGDSVGTEHLAHYDTYPVKIESVDSGTLFLYKYKKWYHKNAIRHTYNIKDVTKYGDYDVIYSTQAIVKDKLPMIRRMNHNFSNLPHGAWGYKRFIWPEFDGRSNDELPRELEYSEEQFKMADKLGERFFRFVKNQLKEEDENPQQLLYRKLQDLCQEAMDRIEYVNQGWNHHLRTGGKCMDYEDYDAYSTPSRDRALENSFKRLEADFDEVVSRGLDTLVKKRLIEVLRAIFKGDNDGPYVSEDLANTCTLKYREGASMNLATLWERLEKGRLSSHPNDSLEHRWGEKKFGRTNCKKWY